MLRLGIPVIGVTDLARAIAFWTSALDLIASEEWRSETWRTLEHADGSGRAIGLLRSDSPAEPRPRLHLDLFTDTEEEQQNEVPRLVRLGARRSTGTSALPSPTSSCSPTRTATSSAWLI